MARNTGMCRLHEIPRCTRNASLLCHPEQRTYRVIQSAAKNLATQAVQCILTGIPHCVRDDTHDPRMMHV